MKFRQHAARLLVATGLVGACLLPAAAAWAHVGVTPGSAAVGSSPTLRLKIPNERQVAYTTIEVDFPAAAPIATATPEPITGWESKVETKTLATPIVVDGKQVTEAVSKVTWSGGSIAPDASGTFAMTIGPVPNTEQLEFKVLQTYADGEVQRWIQPTPPGGEEPEFPAPVLEVTGSTPTTTAAATPTTKAATTPTTVATTPTTAAASENKDDSGLSPWLIALGAGIVIVAAAGGVAIARSRKAGSSD